MRSLVVDDELTSQRLLAICLQDYGDCGVANDGHQALDAVRGALEQNQPFDLICLDIMMPGLDGQETLAEIRRLEQEAGLEPEHRAKVLMVTAVFDEDNVMKQIDEWDAYLVKPIERLALI